MGQKTSVYLNDELAARVKATPVPLAELIQRGLDAPQRPLAKVRITREIDSSACRYSGQITTERELAGIPRPGDRIEIAEGHGCEEIRYVTWLIDGTVDIELPLARAETWDALEEFNQLTTDPAHGWYWEDGVGPIESGKPDHV